MYTDNTVIITGAGASCHYGYPTGAGLIEEIFTASESLRTCFSYCKSQGIANDSKLLLNSDFTTLMHNINDFTDRIYKANPVVIDYFIADNNQYKDEARFLIAYIILKHEAEFDHNYRNGRRNNDWIRFIIEKICRDCRESFDILINKIKFVTFNYDTTIEKRLRTALSARSSFTEKDIEQFLAGNRVVHVYGAVMDGPGLDFVDFAACLAQGNLKHFSITPFLDAIFDSAKQLRVINPHDKDSEKDAIEEASRFINESKDIYILGYGFDHNNNKRIGLDQLVNSSMAGESPKIINFTNYLGARAVYRNTCELFTGKKGEFPPNEFGGAHIRYSDSDVYGALATHFPL
jgi:hypothetical protein